MAVRCFGSEAVTSGLSHVSVADHATLRATAWTVECCVRCDKDPASPGDEYPIIAKGSFGSSAKPNVYLSYLNDSGTRKLKLGFYTSGGAAHSATYAISLTVGRWYSVAGTYDGTTLKLYAAAREQPGTSPVSAYGGTVASATTGGATPNASTEALRFGAASQSGAVALGSYLSIADVRYHSSALSSATLDSRLTTRLVGNESNLLGYWPLHDGLGGRGGTSAYDHAFNTVRNGTLQNGAQWTLPPIDLYYRTGLYEGTLLGWFSGTRRLNNTIVASSENSAYPASNLRCPRQGVTYRSANAAGTNTVTWDFGGTQDVDRFANPFGVGVMTIENHNLTPGALLTVALHEEDGAWGSAPVSETVTVTPGRIVHCFARPYRMGHARISITDTTPSYHELGTCDFWHVLPLDYADVEGRELYVEDPSVSVATMHGHRTTRALNRTRKVTASWASMRRQRAMYLRDVLKACAPGPVWFVADAKRELYWGSVYGDISKLPSDKAINGALTHFAVNGLEITGDRA